MSEFRMRKVMSIDDIAGECEKEKVDYVVSVDAPLVTALNARLPKNLFGFAYTPLQIADACATDVIQAAPDTELETCRKIMHIVPRATLRFTHSTVKKIQEIRRYTKEVPDYLSKKEKEIYEAYTQTHALDVVMDKVTDEDVMRFLNGKDTAVVDIDFFSAIDKMMAPHANETYINNSTLEDLPEEDFIIDRIYSIGNDRQIAECVTDLITPENCNDVAIVLDADGSIAEAVRGALYRKNLPFKNNMAVKDLAAIRDFLHLMSLSVNFKTVRVGDVRELFSSYGAKGNSLSPRADGYLLCKFSTDYLKNPDGPEDATTSRLRGIMERIGDGEITYDEVVSELPKTEGKSSVKILLRDMSIGDRYVEGTGVTDLEYAVNNIDDLKHNEQIPEDERRGVLLADCKKSTYIDRSVVFFIGLDDSWHNSSSGKEYIKDPQSFEEKEAMRLRILLQQGDSRVYIIRPSTNGKVTTPCLTFETIADIEGRPCRITGFKDICDNIVHGSWHKDESADPRPKTETEREPVKTAEPLKFDKTNFNNWMDCPHRFAFRRLLSGSNEDDSVALFGSFIHEFAEFSFCYPDLAKEGFDRYVDILLEKYSGISNTCLSELDACRFRNIMKHVMSYTASVRPDGLIPDADNSTRKYPNFLIAEEKDRTGNKYSTLAETRLDSEEHRLYAIPDLVVKHDIYDYKTGSAKKHKDIVNAFIDSKELAEYQPLFYLKALQEHLDDDEPVRFNLVFFGNHVAETVAETVEDDIDMSKSIRTIEASPLNDAEFMRHYNVMDRIYDDIRDMPSYKKFVPKWERVCEVVDEIASTNGWIHTDDTLETMIGNTGIGVTKTDRKQMNTFMNRIDEFMKPAVVIDGVIIVRRRLLEEFAEKVDGEAAVAEEYLELPVFTNPHREKVNCKYCEYKSVCMSALADDYEGGEE